MKIIGVYAGTFNPFHSGHMNIVNQACQMFDRVIIAHGKNPDKPVEDIDVPDSISSSFEIGEYDGLLTDYIQQLEEEFIYTGFRIVLIRGLRNGDDLSYEQNQLKFMKKMYPELKVMFITCDPEFEHISSSALRQLRRFSEEEYQSFIPRLT